MPDMQCFYRTLVVTVMFHIMVSTVVDPGVKRASRDYQGNVMVRHYKMACVHKNTWLHVLLTAATETAATWL